MSDDDGETQEDQNEEEIDENESSFGLKPRHPHVYSISYLRNVNYKIMIKTLQIKSLILMDTMKTTYQMSSQNQMKQEMDSSP